MSNQAAHVGISVIVITMNRSADLAECLTSLQAQDYPAFEIVVVDNNSTDGTCELLARDFPSVRVLALRENQGVSGGRNRGAEFARFPIAVFIDDDATLPDPASLRRIERHFRADADVSMLALTILESTTGTEERKSIPRRDKRIIDTDYECTYFCGAGFACRRTEFLALGGFWEPLVYGSQELDLSYKLLDGGKRIRHVRDVTVIHKSVPTARPTGQWIYFNTRDRPWVAIRKLPWRFVITTTVLWWGQTFLKAIRQNELGSFFRGVRDCILGLRNAWQGRNPVHRLTRQKLAQLSGRLWY